MEANTSIDQNVAKRKRRKRNLSVSRYNRNIQTVKSVNQYFHTNTT